MIRIALVDDNKELLDLLSHDLEKESGFEVSLHATNGIDFLNKMSIQNEFPHVVLMDVDMPRMGGIQTVKEARELYPEVHFVMFSVMDDEETLFNAIKAGAHGYILKEDPIEAMIMRLRDVVENGAVPFSPSMAKKALNLVKWAIPPVKHEIEQPLTVREREILELLSDGFNSNEIADQLFISFHTVRKHISNIYDKLQVSTQAEAVKKGFLQRWLGFK